MSWARCAGIMSPVSSMSMACLGATLRDSATIGVEQNRPMLTPGVAKRESSAATARSQDATSWAPAAVATPWTRAITGWGSATTACISWAQLSKVSRTKSGSSMRARSSRRSWPAQNAGPAPAMTSTRTLSSSAMAERASIMAPISSRLSALRAGPRFMVRVVTPSGVSARSSTASLMLMVFS